MVFISQDNDNLIVLIGRAKAIVSDDLNRIDWNNDSSWIRRGYASMFRTRGDAGENLCLTIDINNVTLQQCKSEDEDDVSPDQFFYFDQCTKQIMSTTDADFCLEYDFTEGVANQSGRVYGNLCDKEKGQQKWYYIPETKQVKSEISSSFCLDYSMESGNVLMRGCEVGRASQRFEFSNEFFG